MAREILVPQTLWQNYTPVTAGVLALVFASDPINGDQFAILGTEILLVQNVDTIAHTFSVNATPDRIGRVADLTGYSVPAGSVVAIQFSILDGWVQTDGNVYLVSNDVTLKFAVVRHA